MKALFNGLYVAACLLSTASMASSEVIAPIAKKQMFVRLSGGAAWLNSQNLAVQFGVSPFPVVTTGIAAVSLKKTVPMLEVNAGHAFWVRPNLAGGLEVDYQHLFQATNNFNNFIIPPPFPLAFSSAFQVKETINALFLSGFLQRHFNPRLDGFIFAGVGGGWINTQNTLTTAVTGVTTLESRTLNSNNVAWRVGLGGKWAFNPSWGLTAAFSYNQYGKANLGTYGQSAFYTGTQFSVAQIRALILNLGLQFSF